MAEISLVVTSHGPGAPVTTVALAEGGTGVSSIPPASMIELLSLRDRIVEMMNGSPRMSSDDLRKFGKLMGRLLFGGDVGATWNGASNNTDPLITRLLATTQELKSVPWEYAAWPSGVDGPQRANSVVRLVPQARILPIAPAAKKLGLRILLLSASPLTLDAIPWPDIRDSLIRVFRAAMPGIEVVGDDAAPTTKTFLRIVDAATRQHVQSWIAKDDPHVVHFVGHGTAKGLVLVNGKNSKPSELSAAAFEGALQAAPSRRLVILSACDTANHAGVAPVDETIGTFAEQLVCNAVPAAVASQTVIDKATIAAFCDGLYSELLASGSIDLAVAAGRCKVAFELDTPSSAAIEWGIPVLYRRLGAAQLFECE